eukprot:CAMPEP_0119354388 /NCGR_PEP_ID=MMETSP1334-20130426/3392_1 /TAXON_ID=127549 /ORGANISM="Calcidiscus leptoporus, Strain RCC1130" /LENGTH=379 /DNA_ID=CAMNT_0007367921 /DNA_START=94 /DNA_END=1233 /DNA_ORIENTATION=-
MFAMIGYDCPGSPAPLFHASCKVSVSAEATCSSVRTEMLARVNGQYSKWHDPHNNGTYSVTDSSDAGRLSLQRLTGDKKYTDKINFVFADDADGSCHVQGCSESQVTSFSDYSTNYCNMRMLYCGSANGCHPVLGDVSVSETEVKPSTGAGDDPSACLLVKGGSMRGPKQLEQESDCPVVTTQSDFNLTEFVVGGKWYIHQQMNVLYLPSSNNYCVTASYEFKSAAAVKVHNYANVDKVNGQVEDSDANVGLLGGICGKVVDSADPSKLSVGPCNLPTWLPGARGPYWIVAAGPSPAKYEWALVSGGQPTISTPNGCRTGEGINNSGLWIFTRSQARDEALLSQVRAIAAKMGYDLTVLKDVQQEGCDYTPASARVMLV